MAYNVAIFFDNLKSHVSRISGICNGRIKSVYVGGDADIDVVPFTDVGFRQYWERREFAKNTYLRHVRRVSPGGDTYDPSSGLKERDANELLRWLDDTSDRGERAVFIDWDRTITLFEGIVVSLSERDRGTRFDDLFPSILIEDMLLYLCGGEERLSMIRNMLRNALRRNVDVYILTNNDACSYRFFRDMVDGLLGPGEIKVVCSGDAPYNGNKVKAIRKFIRGCSSMSMRRRSKTSVRRTLNRQLGGGCTRRRKTSRK